MAVLKSKEIANMTEKDITDKIKELKVELIKARVGNKKSSKLTTRELRKAIARLLTFKNMKSKKKNKAKIEEEKEKSLIKSKEDKK